MAVHVDIKVNKGDLARVERLLAAVPKEIPGVMSRSINRTLRSAKGKAAKRIAQDIKVKQKQIRRQVAISKANHKRWQGSLTIWGRAVPLIGFGARQTKRGVSYMLAKAEGRQMIPSAFIATMPTGHRGVFTRTTDERLPIRERFGPSVPTLVKASPRTLKDILRASQSELHKQVRSQIDYVLKKRSGR